MHCVETPQTGCLAAVARADITPPVGIYHRMWGAAKHDRATGVHRPLTATLLWLMPQSGNRHEAVLIAALDHCILDEVDIRLFQQAVADAVDVRPQQLQVALSHTHAAGLMSRTRRDLPGGDLIDPYLDQLAATLASLAQEASERLTTATIVYGVGRCNLAAERDYFDEERKRFVCGFNPNGAADDTLVVARVAEASGKPLATLVNYACHPTTLAWDNTAISPDFVGTLRETIEQQIPAPCLFVQGASGDLGPREGFVGDWKVADRNGRQLAFSALAALEALPPPATSYAYQGPVVSGTLIGTWAHVTSPSIRPRDSTSWSVTPLTIPLPYRPDLPTLDDTRSQLQHWQDEETRLRDAGDPGSARDCRARAEQMTRQLWRLESLPAGKCYPLSVLLAKLGDAFWLFVPGEHYQALQTTLRQRFPEHPWIVSTISGGWQPGYVPPASKYGYGIYQEEIALVGAGAAELVIEAVARAAHTLRGSCGKS